MRYALVRNCRETARKEWRPPTEVLSRDVVQDRKNDLAPFGILASGQSIKLGLRPLPIKEVRAKDNDTVSRLGQALVNLLPQAIANRESEVVVPHLHPS